MKKTLLTFVSFLAFSLAGNLQEISKAVITSSISDNLTNGYVYEVTDLVTGEVYQYIASNLDLTIGQQMLLVRFQGDGRFMRCLAASKNNEGGNGEILLNSENIKR